MIIDSFAAPFLPVESINFHLLLSCPNDTHSKISIAVSITCAGIQAVNEFCPCAELN